VVDRDEAEGQNSTRLVMGVVVGLGAMRGRIAVRLLSQGNLVYGTNHAKATAGALIGRGPRWCEKPRQVTEAADAST